MRFKKTKTLASLKSGRRVVIIGKKVKLREKRLSDARNDYAWQMDEELSMLDAAPKLDLSFPLYLLEYSEQLKDFGQGRYPLAVVTSDGKHIGNCTCYDIDDMTAEAQVGIMIGDRDYWGKGYGTDAMSCLVDYLFMYTDLKRAYLKTLEWNARAQLSFKKCGFTTCGNIDQDGKHFIVMELTRPNWEKRQSEEEKTNEQPAY
jgi:RimJ/RimL family protein N-acetyltransferase